MLTYQILVLIVFLISTLIITERYRKDVLSTGVYVLWIILWLLILIAAIFPNISIKIASATGLGRGLDLLYIVAIILLLYIVFKLYNKIDDEKKRLNTLVSELALKEHENDDKE